MSYPLTRFFERHAVGAKTEGLMRQGEGHQTCSTFQIRPTPHLFLPAIVATTDGNHRAGGVRRAPGQFERLT